MTLSEARRIVETADYQPWRLVEQAKKKLGIPPEQDPPEVIKAIAKLKEGKK